MILKLQHWEFIPEPVRPYFVGRVAIVGPESAGKTTLAAQLAARFQTVWAHEYGRAYVNTHPLAESTLQDIEAIARGQQALEEQRARQANRLLFCDTDLLTTTLWSHHFFNECPAWIAAAARAAPYDLTLLLAPDVAWIDDPQRVGIEFSAEFYAKLKSRLQEFGREFVEISGSYEARWQRATETVSNHFPDIQAAI